ncbi:hypothetical protein ABZ897_14655 [Nonomuraea sp. NPDC046802]|uniref:hypothetical protein n=1 Tax=Nonomuraea sp. NPDC046802 TaxID=3154919 RepID=UPI003404685C
MLFVAPAAHADVAEKRELKTASACQSGPWYPDYSYVFGSPYSFTFGSTRVKHAQLRLSDKNSAWVTTKWPGMKIWLERTDGKVCGPKKVVSQGDGTYFASVKYLSNPGHGIRVCIKYRTGTTKCGKWKKE